MVSEIDIRDWERSEETIKLYEVPRGSIVSVAQYDEWRLIFDHIDGAYSFCKDMKTNEIVHLAAWCDVNMWYKKEKTSD